MNVCSICGFPNPSESGYSNGNGGVDHYKCWTKAHPPKPISDIKGLISGGPDPVLARHILYMYFDQVVTIELQEELVRQYNNELMRLWRLRCE